MTTFNKFVYLLTTAHSHVIYFFHANCLLLVTILSNKNPGHYLWLTRYIILYINKMN